LKLSKSTPDYFFKITIESDMFDDAIEDEGIPVDAIEGLILELELIAAELKQFLIESEKEVKNAN